MLKFDPHQVKLYQPPVSSHKGQNGKLLVIGGSRLFHSSIFWSADIASKIVDIVHFTSPANENNQVVRKRIKERFWSGIVVDWADVETYIEEDDAILIGPGMIRDSDGEGKEGIGGSEGWKRLGNFGRLGNLLERAAEKDQTSIIVNSLLKKYPSKRWVIDGGGLQEVESGLITQSCILTPHRKEFTNLLNRCGLWVMSSGSRVRSEVESKTNPPSPSQPDTQLTTHNSQLSQRFHNATILLKGQIDTVCQGDRCIEIRGGNPGMTKGGTGDVLAGLVAALYCKNDAWTATTVGSWANKKAGDELYKKVGPYFNAADLVEEIPKILAKFAKPATSREVSQTSSSAHHKFTR